MNINRYLPNTTDDESKKWFQYILNHPDKPWNYTNLSLNPNITWNIVQAMSDKKWDYLYLSVNHQSICFLQCFLCSLK